MLSPAPNGMYFFRMGRLTIAALLCFPLSQLHRLDVRRNRLDSRVLQLGFSTVRELDLSGCSSLHVDHLHHLSRAPLLQDAPGQHLRICTWS